MLFALRLRRSQSQREMNVHRETLSVIRRIIKQKRMKQKMYVRNVINKIATVNREYRLIEMAY